MSYGWEPPSEVSASGPVDGTFAPHPLGSYICLIVDGKKFRISEGAAFILSQEINGILLSSATNKAAKQVQS